MSALERSRDAQRWLRFAREDLEGAESLISREGYMPRHVCWLSQQAAEKALKGALVSLSTEFPFRHDLDVLRNLLPEGWQTRSAHADLAELTQWAVESRYPGDWPDPTIEEAERSVRQARGVYDTVLADLQQHGMLPGQGGEN